MTCAEKVSYAY